MEDMWIVAPILTGLGVLATFWGITWKMGTDTDSKIGRIYKRFDEYKDHIEDTHTRREVCTIIHEQVASDLTEMKKDIKALLRLANGHGKG